MWIRSAAFVSLAALIASCSTTFTPPEGLELASGYAYLHSTTEHSLFDVRETRLFAVDGKRVLDTESVILEPGPHEVEIAVTSLIFDSVRTLRFDARAGVEYEVRSSGFRWEEIVRYWISESGSGAIVAQGDDSHLPESYEIDRSESRRRWYIDDWGREFGGLPYGEGAAIFVDYSEEYLSIAGVHEAPEYPGMRSGEYEYRDQRLPAHG